VPETRSFGFDIMVHPAAFHSTVAVFSVVCVWAIAALQTFVFFVALVIL
jgi:hypothetical protein